MNNDTRSALKWLARKQRFDGDAASRWGHIYQDAIDLRLVERGPSEVYMSGNFRDIRTPVFLTEEGRKAVNSRRAGE